MFKDALQSKEYVLVRNALRVLARMIKVRTVGGGAAALATLSGRLRLCCWQASLAPAAGMPAEARVPSPCRFFL